MKRKTKQAVSILQIILLLLAVLTSCADSSNPADETATAYRERVLTTDVFGNEFYADDSVDIYIASDTLYSLAGEPNFADEEYLDFYYRFFYDTVAEKEGKDGAIQPREEGTYWEMQYTPKEYCIPLEWAQMHGVIFILELHIPVSVRCRFKIEWYEKGLARESGKNMFVKDNGQFTRGDILLSLYFCAEEMGVNLSDRASIDVYSDCNELNGRESGMYTADYCPVSFIEELESERIEMSSLWSWAEACGMIVWDEDGKINQNELITRGEFAAMVEAFKEHYEV